MTRCVHKYGLFFVLSALYVFSYWSKHIGHILPKELANYLGDFLCVPLVAGTTQFVVARMRGKRDFKLNTAMLVFLVVELSVVFEWLAPRLSSRFTSDVWDVLCYVLGALAFVFWQKKQLLKA